MAQPELVLAPEPKDLRLDLGAGQNVREGFEGVDLLAPEAAHKVDLFKFPWPWEDSSVDELHASHFCEHLPAREVEPRDISKKTRAEDFVGQDFLFAFFDECWRVLKPNGKMLVIVPSSRSDRAFQDPTHRRFIPQALFLYLNAEWRKLQKLDHYRVRCNFGIAGTPFTIPEEISLLNPEAQARRTTEGWNTTHDIHAHLVALK